MVFRLLARWWSKGNWEQAVEPHLLEFLTTSPAKQKRSLLPWIICLSTTLLLLALAGPVWKKNPQPLLQKSLARVLVLDLSYSMLAADIKPTRIERARFKLEDMLKRFVEGETALIGYAGAAFVISPLTHDPATIMALLPGLHPNIMPVPGSRADLAIKLASDLLGRSKVDNGHIIWVTDGIDGLDFSAIESAAGWNSLSILAVGTETGSPIALSGGGFLKDKNGAIVIPKLNTQPLQKLANQAHGSFAILSTDDLDVERIISAETFADEFVEDKRKRTSDKWNEEGPWLVLLALPLAAVLFRRGVLFVWGFVVLLADIAMPYSALAFEWNDLWQRPDQQAAELLQKGETNKAAQRFESPEWKGTAAYRSGDYEKAIEQFSQQDHHRTNFNRGNALAFAGRLQAALDAFKQVLAENPQDEDAQYNHDLIEKLLKEQQNKQQKEQHQEGKQGRKEENKQDQQQKSTNGQEEQSAQSKQESSKENMESNNQNTSEAQNNVDEKESTAGANNGKFKEGKDDSAKMNEVQTKIEESPENEKTKNMKQNLAPEEQAKQQFLEQWLRKIPDDPGRLLRNKMEREFQRRGKQRQQNEQYW